MFLLKQFYERNLHQTTLVLIRHQIKIKTTFLLLNLMKAIMKGF